LNELVASCKSSRPVRSSFMGGANHLQGGALFLSRPCFLNCSCLLAALRMRRLGTSTRSSPASLLSEPEVPLSFGYVSAEVLITNKDPRWVGAWWLGFIFTASMVAIASIPYFFFPREMPKEVRTHRTTSKQEGELVTLFPLFPVVLLRNLKNPIFVMVVLAMVNLSAMIAGLSTFLAKFLEQQFTLSASVANMILGAVNIPGAMLGIILGGVIIKSCNFSLQQATILCIISMAFCALFDVPLLFLGCPTQMIAGLDYSGSSGPWQLITTCNLKCNCSLSFFNPVCGQDRMEYISPCFAGCTKLNINPITKAINYTECNCILVNGAIGYAKPGHCSSSCGHFLMPFVLIAAISGFLGRTRTHCLLVIGLKSPSWLSCLRWD
uniref:Kazal-like domain-containing protein n=1 Tax=Pseudonaja textilis TaxID=8673 RepID=A0A670ZWJ8_PSETE